MTEPNMEWEEEFDKRFVFRYMASLEREDEMQSSADPNEIKAFIRKVETKAYEKGKAEERERIADAFKKWQPLIRDHTRCPNIGSCIGYQNAESDFDNERENFLSLINDNK